MKKIILTLVLLVTGSNLAVGVYAATCTGPGGSRVCGETCSKGSDGHCVCQGSCTKAERDWVAGGGQFAEIEESPVN